MNIKDSISKLPNHIAFNIEDIKDNTENKENIEENKENIEEFLQDKAISFHLNIIKTIRDCLELEIPIFTFHIKPSPEYNNLLAEFIDSLNSELINKNKIKISVLGKWYNLPTQLVDSIKNIIDATKEYDTYFLNLCINYDGQEEIIDGFKILARQIKTEKIDIDDIDKGSIKDNIYTSFFLPPDLIIQHTKKISGFLLWDSVNTLIYYSKPWINFNTLELIKALEFYQSNKEK